MKSFEDLPILRTKLLIPQLRQHAVPRVELLDGLNESAFGDVVLVCAPAGYGKTTLITEWQGKPPLGGLVEFR